MTAVLEFRGVDLHANGRRLQIVRGFLVPPSVRGVDYTIAHKVGTFGGSRVADNLSLTLEGYIAGATPEDWRIATDELFAVLGEGGAAPGNLVARAPYLGMATGVTATLACRVKNVVEGQIFAKMFQRLSIELVAANDPAWVLT